MNTLACKYLYAIKQSTLYWMFDIWKLLIDFNASVWSPTLQYKLLGRKNQLDIICILKKSMAEFFLPMNVNLWNFIQWLLLCGIYI